MEINVTIDQLIAWDNGMLIQDAMPDITPEEREFIMTGMTPDVWDHFFRASNEG